MDNNGWVIVSEDDTQTGQFFGKVLININWLNWFIKYISRITYLEKIEPQSNHIREELVRPGVLQIGGRKYYCFSYLQIRPDVMSMLVEEEVYKTIHVMDYQAVCFREKKTTNPASILLTVRISSWIFQIKLCIGSKIWVTVIFSHQWTDSR